MPWHSKESKVGKTRATTKRKLVEAIFDVHVRINKLSIAQLKASLLNLASIAQGDRADLPTLAISSLSVEDVQLILGLNYSSNSEIADQDPIELPQICVQWMQMTANAFEKKRSIEALTRITLNNLLICAYDYVKSKPTEHSMNELKLNAEGTWRYGPVQYKNMDHDLVGRPGYSLWYGTEEDVAVSVVVVEAKAKGNSSGLAQTLGYMGCVHRRRKDLQRTDATVYGIVSDAYQWVFLKIDNNSEWCDHIVSARGGNYEKVLGLLVHIFRSAAVMSPTHSQKTSIQTHSKEFSNVSSMGFDEGVYCLISEGEEVED